MKRVEIQIKKKDGTMLTGIRAEIQGGGKVAIIYDLTVPVEVGDSVLTKKADGQIVSQKVDKAFIEEMMGGTDFLEDDDSNKGRILFLDGYGLR